MREVAGRPLWAFLVLTLVTTGMAAADSRFHGVVTDEAGKPVRGAIVKGTAGFKSVIRYTHADGRYDIALPPGSYSVSVEAFGLAGKRLTKEATETGETNLALTHRLDLSRLSGADLENLLPPDTP